MLIERTVMCAGRDELGFEFSLRENPTSWEASPTDRRQSWGASPPDPPGYFWKEKEWVGLAFVYLAF